MMNTDISTSGGREKSQSAAEIDIWELVRTSQLRPEYWLPQLHLVKQIRMLVGLIFRGGNIFASYQPELLRDVSNQDFFLF